MAYVRQVSETQATGVIQKIYAAAKSRVGSIANIIRVMSLDGASTNGSMQIYVNLMKHDNALPPARREMLATVVSNANGCYY